MKIYKIACQITYLLIALMLILVSAANAQSLVLLSIPPPLLVGVTMDQQPRILVYNHRAAGAATRLPCRYDLIGNDITPNVDVTPDSPQRPLIIIAEDIESESGQSIAFSVPPPPPPPTAGRQELAKWLDIYFPISLFLYFNRLRLGNIEILMSRYLFRLCRLMIHPVHVL